MSEIDPDLDPGGKKGIEKRTHEFLDTIIQKLEKKRGISILDRKIIATLIPDAYNISNTLVLSINGSPPKGIATIFIQANIHYNHNYKDRDVIDYYVMAYSVGLWCERANIHHNYHSSEEIPISVKALRSYPNLILFENKLKPDEESDL